MEHSPLGGFKQLFFNFKKSELIFYLSKPKKIQFLPTIFFVNCYRDGIQGCSESIRVEQKPCVSLGAHCTLGQDMQIVYLKTTACYNYGYGISFMPS